MGTLASSAVDLKIGDVVAKLDDLAQCDAANPLPLGRVHSILYSMEDGGFDVVVLGSDGVRNTYKRQELMKLETQNEQREPEHGQEAD